MKELKESIEKLLENYADKQGFMITDIDINWNKSMSTSQHIIQIRIVGEAR
jgi:hypothetical protein